VVARNEIYWAELGGAAGRRPVCILSRTAAAQVLNTVTIAPITRTIRGIASEVEIGADEGLSELCVISCDTIASIPTAALDANRTGVLNLTKRAALDQALRYALDIAF
jgi:mRNA interferase MazF